eukprot:TRINITY_DN18686_c0_g1_i1.p1 TRINITY_DN18686_c0_g1~~TRINITY_DN18686_c0_g1_i1.p1  ORF type:complete len:527 (+),score=218.75 TRINITY_DN18686_c0_g1_i1:118-1581(+)
MSATGDGMAADPGEMLQPALLVGNLQVKGSGLIKTWKQRWYELRGSALYYFKAPDGKPSGRIPLEGSDVDAEPPPNPKFRFSINVGVLGKKFEFQAESAQLCETWVKTLKDAIARIDSASPGSPASKGQTKEQKAQRMFGALANLKLFEKEDKARKPITIEDFELLSMLGKGSYGKVIKVKKKEDGQLYALKIMRKDAITKPREVMSERAVLQQVDHPFVVRLINAFQTPSKLCLVLSYLPGGDMKHHLRQGTLFPEEKARFYAAEVLLALDDLHKQNIIYRDLKPENIVLDQQGHAVLTDMGLARELTFDPMAYTFCGTPLYVAPEVLQNRGYTKAVDWWSYGIILYEMLVGITPFAAKTAQAVFQLIMSKQPIIPDVLSQNARDLLARLLVKNPTNRLSDPDKIKGHPFFAGVNWQKLLNRQYAVPGGFQRQRSASEKLTPEQVSALLEEFRADVASKRHQPDTFQGFTYRGDGSDPVPGSPKAS